MYPFIHFELGFLTSWIYLKHLTLSDVQTTSIGSFEGLSMFHVSKATFWECLGPFLLPSPQSTRPFLGFTDLSTLLSLPTVGSKQDNI